MTRRWLAYLPLALILAGTVALPAAAARFDSPAPACTKDTQQVTDLKTAVANLGTDISAATPDATKLGQDAGTLFHAVTAAQAAGCLPALPTASTAQSASPHARVDCAGDTVDLLVAALDQIKAGIGATPDQTAVLKAVSGLVSAITAINADSCLPVKLPTPTVPTLPAP